MPFPCSRCGKSFAKTRDLLRHSQRKRPCRPRGGPEAPRAGAGESKTELAELQAKVASLEAKLRALEQRPATHVSVAAGGSGPVTLNIAETVYQAPIGAWDSDDRLVITLDLLRDAFRENGMLRDYCALPERNRLEPKSVNAYVLEALMAIIRQAHAAPGGRNIRPNPHRADQVQVLRKKGGERWEFLTLDEAVKLLFRDAADSMLRIAGSTEARDRLTPAELEASYLMPVEYRRQPDKYEREGKGRLAAHLATLHPPGSGPGGRPSLEG